MRISAVSKVKSSQMVNVQSPTSPETPEDYGIRGGAKDAGHRTSDIGPGLTVTDLRKSFSSPTGDRIEVLRGASFSAGLGETVAIMGSSGAGKSTLLHVLGGLEAADHGSIVAGGVSIDSAGPSVLSRFLNNRKGFVFLFFPPLSLLSAARDVFFAFMIRRTS